MCTSLAEFARKSDRCSWREGALNCASLPASPSRQVGGRNRCVRAGRSRLVSLARLVSTATLLLGRSSQVVLGWPVWSGSSNKLQTPTCLILMRFGSRLGPPVYVGCWFHICSQQVQHGTRLAVANYIVSAATSRRLETKESDTRETSCCLPGLGVGFGFGSDQIGPADARATTQEASYYSCD